MGPSPAERQAEILEGATRALAEAPDRDAALARIAALAVPALAGACVIDVADGEGAPRRAASCPEGAAPAPNAGGLVVPLRLRGETLADVRLGIDTAMHCGLIVNELVSNAFKHAFPPGRGGRVEVALGRDGDELVLAVTHDGVGLPPALDVHSSPSLGLQLVCSLSDQLDGIVTMKRGAGTAFAVRFIAPPPHA